MTRRLIACALLVWYLPACMTWRVAEGVNVKQFVESEHPGVVRVTLTGGSQKVLNLVSIVPGDTLVGFLRGAPSRIAVSDITQIATRHESDKKTIALGLGIAAFFAAFAAVNISKNK